MVTDSAGQQRQLHRFTHLVSYPRGFRPSVSPTRSLARRCVGALRSRGSLARSLAASSGPACSAAPIYPSRFLPEGLSPFGLPHTLSRAPLRRRAPVAWLARALARGF